jgi:hypothetical protein
MLCVVDGLEAVDDQTVTFSGVPRETASERAFFRFVDGCGQVDNLWVIFRALGAH